MFVLILIAVVLFTTLLYFLIKIQSKNSKLSHTVAPPAALLFGHTLLFKNDMAEILNTLNSLHGTYGKSFRLSLITELLIVTAEQEFVEAILSSNKYIDKSKSLYKFLEPWIAFGLLTSTGSKWKIRRRIITPTFHFKILEQFIEIFNSSTKIFVKILGERVNKGVFDVYPYVTLNALDIICESAMGTPVRAQTNSHSKYVTAVREICRVISLRLFSSWKRSDFLFNLFSSDATIQRNVLKVLHDTTDNVIRKRRAEYEEKKNLKQNETDEFAPKRKLAFLDMLLESTVDGEPLSDLDIREEVDTFMFEGHDTISSAIGFAFHVLSTHPEEQEKVFQEVYSIFGDDKDRDVTYADLQNMNYLELFIKEVLRLYPSVPFIGRTLNEDFHFKGKTYPKGTSILVAIYMMHRDKDYFNNPDVFYPERFINEQVGKNPYIYVPFSAGPRNCIGQKFAMLEMKATLSRVLRHYKILSSGPGYGFNLQMSLILKASNGMHIKLENRKYDFLY